MPSLQPGNIITDLEGHDIGSGAEIVDVQDGQLTLQLLDNDEIIVVPVPDENAYHVDRAPEFEDTNTKWFDEDAMESHQELIRVRPLYYGPRDPNNPSSITDTIWRPEDNWRRMINRFYSVDPKRPLMKIRYRLDDEILMRHGCTYQGMVPRRAEYDPVPDMSVDHPGTTIEPKIQLPRRVRLDRWEPGDSDTLKPDELRDMAIEFWLGYRDKQISYIPEHGNRRNLAPVEWAQGYQRRYNLQYDEMDLLWRFMVAIGLMPDGEYKEWLDRSDLHDMEWPIERKQDRE